MSTSATSVDGGHTGVCYSLYAPKISTVKTYKLKTTIKTKQSVINLSGLRSSLAGLEKTQLDSNHGSLHFRQLSQVGHLLPAPETTRETKGRRQHCAQSGRPEPHPLRHNALPTR